MQQFGIFSPTMGLKQDFPVLLLPEAYTAESENVRIVEGEIRRTRMRSPVLRQGLGDNLPVDLPQPALHFHWFLKATGSGYLFAFCATEIYKWVPKADEIAGAWAAWCTPAVTATYWSVVTFADKMIATNGVNKVLVGSDADEFEILDPEEQGTNGIRYSASPDYYLTAAAWVVVFENYVFLGDTTENSTRYPRRIRWCALGDYETWDSGDAGAADIGDAEALTAAATYQDFLILFKRHSIHRLWLTGGDLIFANSVISSKIGCESPASIVTASSGELYFLAFDKTIRNLQGERVSEPIDETLKAMPDGELATACGTRIEEYDELWWSIASGADATANNKIITLSREGKWGTIGYGVTAFGIWKNQTNYTIDTVPFDTIDDWDWDGIDSVEALVGFYIDIGGDTAGAVHGLHNAATDDGSAFAGYFVLATDMTEANNPVEFKRVLNIRLFASAEASGTLAVSVKEDNATAWTSLGSASLVEAGSDVCRVDLPCDFRARHTLLKISGSNPFAFLGAVFDFSPDGFDE
ncbi:MAG TPA: hypothetical protein VM223_08715 [Planctomycetota bacterium]|nr:hypothetical protein [Planctomycetota bacterium]